MDHVIDRGMFDDNDILTTTQCAEVAGINRRTVLEWIHRGDLPAVRRAGRRGRYRIKWSDFWAAMHQPAAKKAKSQRGTGQDG